MQSRVAYASSCRAPAAARCSVLRSLIPSRLPLGTSTERSAKPPSAVRKTLLFPNQKSEASSWDSVTDEGVSRGVTQTSQWRHHESQVALKRKSDGLDTDTDVKVHALRSGVVKSVTKHGIFVDIGGGSTGILHYTQISSERISKEDLKNMFSVGDEIKVMIHGINNGGRRFSLSTKSLEVNPGDMAKNPQLVYEKAEEAAAAFRSKFAAREQHKEVSKYGEVDSNLKVHDLRSGVVTSVERRGVYVDIGAGCNGFLHCTQISSESMSKEAIEKMFSVGDEIKVIVLQINKDRQQFYLTTKSLEVNPGDMVKNPQLVYEKAEEMAAALRAKVEARELEKKKAKKVDPDLKVLDLRSGVVQSVKRYGCFVDIGAGAIGLLPEDQISSSRLSKEDIEKMFSLGDQIKVMVCQIDKFRQRINLSTKRLELNPGDMVKDSQLVYEKAEEAAAAFRAKVEQAGAARAAGAAAGPGGRSRSSRPEKEKARKVAPSFKVNEVISGVVQTVDSYRVVVDIGPGLTGLLAKDQISSERVSKEDINKIFSVGDEIKVMVYRIDKDDNRVRVSTKRLELNRGDMVKDPQLVYEKAEEAAAAFRAKLAATEGSGPRLRQPNLEVPGSGLRLGPEYY